MEPTKDAQRAMDLAGAHPGVAEIELAVVTAKNEAPKPHCVGGVAYAATISGAAMPLGVVARQGERYDEGYLGNNHRFASAPFGSNPPKYRH